MKTIHAVYESGVFRPLETVELAECDQRALERFQMLDAIEAEDGEQLYPVCVF